MGRLSTTECIYLPTYLWYGGGGGRSWGRCCWCAPGVWALGGVAWQERGPSRGAALCWRVRWRAP